MIFEDELELIIMERSSITFEELDRFLKENKDNEEHIFKHPQVILMSWGCFKQQDRPPSCFVADDPDNMGCEPKWY